LQQSPPIIVRLIDAPRDPTGLARVVFQALGLTGVIAVTAIALGFVLAAIMFWIRRRQA
jgi:hypothetical protein